MTALEPTSWDRFDRTAWLEWRQHGIGGSDIAALLGESRYGSPYTVWADKVGLLPPSESSERMHIGKELEPVLDGLFTRRTGLHVTGQQTWCIDTDAPHRRCTVDGFVYEGPRDPGWAKLCGGGALGTVQHKTDYRRPWKVTPDDIRAQCVWEMGVTRLQHCWLSVLHGTFGYEVYEIPWDATAQDDWAYMTEVADAFWRDHVLTGTAPPIDGSDATAHALADIYPEEEPGTRAEVEALAVEQWHTARSSFVKAKATLQAASNTVKGALEDAEIGTVDGYAAVTLRAQTRKIKCKACGHVEESDPFRVLRDAPKKLRDLPPIETIELETPDA